MCIFYFLCLYLVTVSYKSKVKNLDMTPWLEQGCSSTIDVVKNSKKGVLRYPLLTIFILFYPFEDVTIALILDRAGTIFRYTITNGIFIGKENWVVKVERNSKIRLDDLSMYIFLQATSKRRLLFLDPRRCRLNTLTILYNTSINFVNESDYCTHFESVI